MKEEKPNKEIVSYSESDTESFAEAFATRLEPGDILLLYGGLGAGKTAFVRGLARGLHCGHDVSSPTYILGYECGGQPPLMHYDLYRLNNADEAEEIGFFENADYVCAVEWPEIVEEELDIRRCYRIYLSVNEDESREIKLFYPEGIF